MSFMKKSINLNIKWSKDSADYQKWFFDTISYEEDLTYIKYYIQNKTQYLNSIQDNLTSKRELVYVDYVQVKYH